MPLDLASHHFLVYVSLGGVIGEKIENLSLKPDYEAVLDFKHICFINYGFLGGVEMECQRHESSSLAPV